MNAIEWAIVIYYAGIMLTFVLSCLRVSRIPEDDRRANPGVFVALTAVFWPIFLTIIILVVLLRGVRLAKNVLT